MFDLEQPDNLDDALRMLVKALGGAAKVGRRLRPTFDKSENWVQNCLNPEHPQFFHPEHVFALLGWAAERGYHDVKHYLDRLTHYNPSTPMALDTQVLVALAEVKAAQRVMEEKARALQEVADLSPGTLALMQHANIRIP